MPRKPKTKTATDGLRHRAEVRLQKIHPSKGAARDLKVDAVRALHELEVHQIELQMQNVELQKAREQLEGTVEDYTDLYDFAPVGYFSLNQTGVIMKANLTAADMLGVERSRLVGRRMQRFVAPASQPAVVAFLERVFARNGKQVCEASLVKASGATFWAGIHGASAVSANGQGRWCLVAISDITSLKQAEEAQRRAETLGIANRELRLEILHRQEVEEALKKSEQHYSHLLEESRLMHDQLRLLSRQVLSAQEEERKRISRELHDVIAQTLTSINIQLATLKNASSLDTKGLNLSIARTQQLVENSVKIVHKFVRELRPTVLDDLGLIPALHTFMKGFREDTGIRVSLSAFAGIEQIDGDMRTVLYRVAQESLTNVARHAQASEAKVKIQKLENAVYLKVIDNGKGFTSKKGLHSKWGKRLGLVGMRERLEMVGGSFTITSTAGRGTTVVAQIPLIPMPGGGGG
jgi:PAS domain S-box-containing protein